MKDEYDKHGDPKKGIPLETKVDKDGWVTAEITHDSWGNPIIRVAFDNAKIHAYGADDVRVDYVAIGAAIKDPHIEFAARVMKLADQETWKKHMFPSAADYNDVFGVGMLPTPEEKERLDTTFANLELLSRHIETLANIRRLAKKWKGSTDLIREAYGDELEKVLKGEVYDG